MCNTFLVPGIELANGQLMCHTTHVLFGGRQKSTQGRNRSDYNEHKALAAFIAHY